MRSSSENTQPNGKKCLSVRNRYCLLYLIYKDDLKIWPFGAK